MPQLIASAGGVNIRHLDLSKGRTTFGRKRHNDVVFDDLVVSGDHCVFELLRTGEVYLEDLGSTNGTYVNGVLISARLLLRHQDVVLIGNFRVEFLTDSPEPDSSDQKKTNAMSLDELGLPGTSGARRASLKTLSGAASGRLAPLLKAVTTFGQPGIAVVSISHRRDGYYVARMDGPQVPTLNGLPLGTEATALAEHDVLNLAGTELEFLLNP